jgi:hypothetical protein
MPAHERPIFLVGCPRSGTTLLSAMLHAHPRIAMPPETRFLMRVYERRARFGDLSVAGNRRELARAITAKRTRFADLGLDRARTIEEIVDGPPTIGSATGIVWRQFADSRGKARWGEKRPAYWQNMDVVLRLFPDAQIIHLVRDGRACVASLKQVHWYRGAADAAVSWSLAERELTRLGAALPSDSYVHVRYEDLLANPGAELARLCAFLGEEFDEVMLDHAAAARDIVPDRKTWHDRTKGEIDIDRIDAWRTTLAPDEIGLVERVLGRGLVERGYELSGAGSAPSTASIAAYHRIRVRRRGGMAAFRLRDAARRRRESAPLADQSAER